MTKFKEDDWNAVVYRYLRESGLDHTAFNFWHEAAIAKAPIDPSTVPSRALETFVEKGIEYLKLDRDPDDSDVPFVTLCDYLAKQRKGKEVERDISIPSTPRVHEFLSSEVLILEGHKSKVFTCAWSPATSFLVDSLLASGSEDTTARIWTLEDTTSGFRLRRKVHIMKHCTSTEKRNEVTALDWKPDGTFLATGSSSGRTRIYSSNGEVNYILGKQEGAISCIKWNNKDYIISGSHDNSVIVSDAKTKKLKQHFKYHSGSILSADWRNDVTFATGSADSMVHVYTVGKDEPVKKFSGHKGYVNCVKWDPTGQFLASCSADTTVKIWKSADKMPIHDFKDHTKEVYKIRWGNPNGELLLASASHDSTIKLWDVRHGKFRCSLNHHSGPVYALSFSPDCEYLATGSLDKWVHIWSVEEGQLIKSYLANGGILDISWSKEGDKIAVATDNHTVIVLDFKMLNQAEFV